MLQPGSTVADRFRLLKLLGEGGFGAVWEAWDLLSNRTVAIKLLHQTSSQHARRLFREARVLMALRHENIVAVEEVLLDEVHGPLLCMEILHGETLRQRLLKVDFLPLSEALSLCQAVAQGLAAAHQSGAIHRDLKPENIFLETSRTGNRDDFLSADTQELLHESLDTPPGLTTSQLLTGVKILDFGVVKLVALEGAASLLSSTLTRKGTVVGTVGYMAPEQYWSDEEIDARADLWALGAVAYESLTGAVPVAASLPNQFLVRLKQNGITPLKSMNSALPDALCSLIERLLAFDREQRPSLQEVIKVIEACVRELEVGS